MTTYIGLIGGGNITETHARAARALSGVEIAAVYGTNADKVARVCREHGGKPYSDLVEFLAHRPMDLVAIGSPSGLAAVCTMIGGTAEIKTTLDTRPVP